MSPARSSRSLVGNPDIPDAGDAAGIASALCPWPCPVRLVIRRAEDLYDLRSASANSPGKNKIDSNGHRGAHASAARLCARDQELGSVLYLADQVARLQEEKQDKPSISDSEINDQKISRPVLRMAMDIISGAGEDEGLRTRIYKALRSFQ
jgi:hypothetical protein